MNFIKSLTLTTILLSSITYIAKAEINVIASVKPLLLAGLSVWAKSNEAISKKEVKK